MEFYMRGTASVLIDGQYGSTGKGLLAGYLAKTSSENGHVIHTTNAAPNAGHTTKWITSMMGSGVPIEKTITTYHLPTGACLRPGNLAYLNAGAVIDLVKLVEEHKWASSVLGRRIHTMIHPSAVMLQLEDQEYEMEAGSRMGEISSTRKGVGRAIARKVMREAKVAGDYGSQLRDAGFPVQVLDLNKQLKHGSSVSIEVPQGLSLGLNHGGFYPYCTSREVSVAQALSDAGIHPRFLGMVALSMRTYPIRVGSLQGSTSGGYYHDQKEVTWESIGQKPELTTVTKRVRRVFTWSRQQYREALTKTMPSVVFLNFCNYFRTMVQFSEHVASMHDDHSTVGHKPMLLFGFGPYIEDVTEARDADAKMAEIIKERDE